MYLICIALTQILWLSPTLPKSGQIPPAGNVVTWITETDHDFGEVRPGSTVKFTFSFRNTFNQPIVLQNVRTTCGCTAADWPEAPIAPGEKGDIHIEFDGNRTGAFRKKITAFFDKQRKAEVLWIQGEVTE